VADSKKPTRPEESAREDGALGFPTVDRTPVAYDVRPAGALKVDGGGENVASGPDGDGVPENPPTSSQRVKRTAAES